MTMQNKITGNKIGYRPMIEAELSASERDAVYRRQQRQARIASEARRILSAASRDLCESRPKDARWFCLQVKSQRESLVEKHLTAANVEAFLPVERRTDVRHGKKFEFERPFFPGYVMVRCVPRAEAFHALFQQKNVVDIVGSNSKFWHITDADVAELKSLFEKVDVSRMASDKSFRDGDRASIEVGPFKGLDCTLLAVQWCRQAWARVVIQVMGRDFEIARIPLAFLKKL
jgi:transcriptional antiterminator NusG